MRNGKPFLSLRRLNLDIVTAETGVQILPSLTGARTEPQAFLITFDAFKSNPLCGVETLPILIKGLFRSSGSGLHFVSMKEASHIREIEYTWKLP